MNEKPHFIKAQNVIKPGYVHLYTVLRCRGVSGDGWVGGEEIELGRGEGEKEREGGRGQNEKLGLWKVESGLGNGASGS